MLPPPYYPHFLQQRKSVIFCGARDLSTLANSPSKNPPKLGVMLENVDWRGLWGYSAAA